MAELVFLGTPVDAVPTLEALVRAGHHVRLVVTRPDRRRGRGGATAPSPVSAAAQRLGLAVTDDLAAAGEVGAEFGVVVAYGRIVPAELLARLPMVNVHFSLLPRWRGAAPVERAVLAGDAVTGVSLMGLEAGLDTGPVYATERTAIGKADTTGELRTRLAAIGARLAVELLRDGVAGLAVPVPQAGTPTYAEKLMPEELHLQWGEPAELLARRVRVGSAWTTFRGRRLRVLEAVGVPGPPTGLAPGTLDGSLVITGDGFVELRTVQPESRRPMDLDDWARGVRPRAGERLGDPPPGGPVAAT